MAEDSIGNNMKEGLRMAKNNIKAKVAEGLQNMKQFRGKSILDN